MHSINGNPDVIFTGVQFFNCCCIFLNVVRKKEKMCFQQTHAVAHTHMRGHVVCSHDQKKKNDSSFFIAFVTTSEAAANRPDWLLFLFFCV